MTKKHIDACVRESLEQYFRDETERAAAAARALSAPPGSPSE